MTIYFCIEDELSRQVALRLIVHCCGPEMGSQEIGKAHGGFGYIKKNLSKFYRLSQHAAVLVITDLDRAVCAPSLRSRWLSDANIGEPLNQGMIFCIAVTEIESWLLADKGGISDFLGISPAKIKGNIEREVVDAKEYLVSLVRSSKKSDIKIDILPTKNSIATTGLSYNFRLSEFVRDHWNPDEAAQENSSLRRTINRLLALDI